MMSAKENLYIAAIVFAFGLIIYLLIPFQVSTDSIPGSLGFSEVGPDTLPRLSALGIIITGLVWGGRSMWEYLRVRRARDAVPGLIHRTAGDDEPKKWLWPIMTWVGMMIYVTLIPVWGYTEASFLFGLIVGLAMARNRPNGLQPYASTAVYLFIGVVLVPLSLGFVFYKYFHVILPTGPISRVLLGW